MNIQASAAKVITKVVSQQKSLDEILAVYLPKLSPPLDQALLQELSYGTLRWYQRLDVITKLLLHQTTKKIDSLVYTLIMLGLYQLLYLRTPYYAALNETVAAARLIKKPWATGLVNAVLRNFLRQKENILKKIEHNNIAQYSHPDWLIKSLQQAWPQKWQDILTANNEYPPMHLRVNLRKITREDYLKQLEQLKIAASPCSYLAAAITLAKPCNITKLPGFENGLVSVQDLAAQHAPSLLELEPNMRVLDACAAPGGKTAHILESQTKLQELIALDIDDERLQLVKANLARLQLSAKLLCGDATKSQSWWDGKKFDRILIDAPCSGTGVIRHHPDIKLLRQKQDITNYSSRQLALLKSLWPLLNEGGILVYVTCSLLPDENFIVVKDFLKIYNDAKERPIAADLGLKVMHGRQFFPTTKNGDGFYYAVITKCVITSEM